MQHKLYNTAPNYFPRQVYEFQDFFYLINNQGVLFIINRKALRLEY